MNIDFNRICRLAGIESNSKRSLNEGSNRTWQDDPALGKELTYQYIKGQLNEDDGGYSEGVGEDEPLPAGLSLEEDAGEKFLLL